MKKLLQVIITGMFILLLLASCSNKEQESTNVNSDSISTYVPEARFYFDSIEELYRGIRDLPQENLNELRRYETEFKDRVNDKRYRVSQAERRE